MLNNSVFKKTVTILSLVTALLALFVFITGKQSLASVFQSDETVQETVIDNSSLEEGKKDTTYTSSDKGNVFYRYYNWNSSYWWKTVSICIVVMFIIFFTIRDSKGFWHDIYELIGGILGVISFWSVLLAIISYLWNLIF
ncbi:hypothetical protein IMCC3317_14220 [Kordia antarctica]|uniref:Uncharacterized protein n=1 Tax=Kordia antarctica TaxID=1218801 RepID=A0A7L4ZI17_9FLAO|nr:hypothetical protein [Kordia antarctica]QHI36069.1 hypothetical protein IMCC3317_14220 [Kordia antarctica]